MTEQEAISVLKMIATHGSLPTNAKDEAIKALEEIQQYREYEKRLETVYGDCSGLLETLIESLERHDGADIGEPVFKSRLLTDEDVDKWEAYKAIGTPEECRAAVEKMKPKKTAIEAIKVHICPVCGFGGIYDYCGNCGQRVQMLSD